MQIEIFDLYFPQVSRKYQYIILNPDLLACLAQTGSPGNHAGRRISLLADCRARQNDTIRTPSTILLPFIVTGLKNYVTKH